jgi:hypothetical protein
LKRYYKASPLVVVITFLAWAGRSGAATIDRIHTNLANRLLEEYDPGRLSLVLLGSAELYELNDGSSWTSGAGSVFYERGGVSRVDVDGDTIRYTLDVPVGSRLFEQTDYSASDSSNGRLDTTAPLVLVAGAGSTTATISGLARVASNDPANYAPPVFKYFTAPVGSLVPFESIYRLLDSKTFTPTTFDAPFRYTLGGVINLVVPEPTGVGMAFAGCLLLGRRHTGKT